MDVTGIDPVADHLFDAGVCDHVASKDFAASSVPYGEDLRKYLRGDYKKTKKPVFLSINPAAHENFQGVYASHLLAREVYLATVREIILLNLDYVAPRYYDICFTPTFQRAHSVIVYNLRTLDQRHAAHVSPQRLNDAVNTLEELVTNKAKVHIMSGIPVQELNLQDTFLRQVFLQQYKLIGDHA